MNRAYYRAIRSAAGMFKTSSTIKTLSLTGRIPLSESIEILLSTATLPKSERKRVKEELFSSKYHQLIDKIDDHRLKNFCQIFISKKTPADPFVCAILSGHGPSKKYLHRFGRSASTNCVCGELNQDFDHLAVCPAFPNPLSNFEELNSLQQIEIWCKTIYTRARKIN